MFGRTKMCSNKIMCYSVETALYSAFLVLFSISGPTIGSASKLSHASFHFFVMAY